MSETLDPSGDAGLRVEIAGRWTATDLVVLVGDIEWLYELFEPNDRELGEVDSTEGYINWSDYWSPWMDGLGRFGPGLRLAQISHSSPGFLDVFGLPEVVKEVRLFLQYLIDIPLEWGDRHEKQLGQQIENTNRLIDTLIRTRDLELDDQQKETLSAQITQLQGRLSALIARGQVTGIQSASPRPA